MNIKSHSFSDLPFSKLFKDYVEQKKEITDFFEIPPFSTNDLVKKSEDISFPSDRNKVSDALKEFNSQFEPSEATHLNIEKLRDPKTLAVVTGQQMVLYGGPVYTVLKTLTAIQLAKKYEQELNRPVVPVFWLADEDHDIEEISQLGLMNRDEMTKCSDSFEEPGKRVGQYSIKEVHHQLRTCIKSGLIDTDFSNKLWEILDSSYNEKHTVVKAFGLFMQKLFGSHGLIIAGSNDDTIKSLSKSTLTQSISKADDIADRLKENTKNLKKLGYEGQVHLNNSNLFYISDNGQRVKIQYDGDVWFIDNNDKRWSSNELIQDINENPNQFSPNVFLRPILQDRILPTLSYVAGPGEIAYYAQMRGIYEYFDQSMPQIVPRFSATLIESSVDRIMDKLPFGIKDYSKRIEDLESEYIEQTDQPDLEKIFGDWKQRIDSITDEKKSVIGEIDPTLKNTAGKASATYFSELDKLKGKLYKSLKQQEKTQLERILKIKSNLFPNGNLQEREIAFIYYLNKYGTELFDEILTSLENQKPDTHKLIKL
ncbi:bacillithiol biosynthesis cysteine-adding enzyme BshC [Rhodohalobacter sp.]|uniref:bacillithiol biosynthesis cysteine-adding enzyme BshC n=1 Tax=Rhodohalobacter sp. TaxID=1974210 RepID=UPI002ACD3E27|nr:bacillithiol biosynthesis cysteine-adding enzyme BshC [Rhodohalobacter sp.]MDZ7757339.1 bacillithiol biosynthesis cysteine-adding enzyme BshC [Rhodohalobacter sp.]